VQTVTDHLRESPVGEQLAALPRGLPQLIRRPKGPIDVPDFRALALERWAASESKGRTRKGATRKRAA